VQPPRRERPVDIPFHFPIGIACGPDNRQAVKAQPRRAARLIVLSTGVDHHGYTGYQTFIDRIYSRMVDTTIDPWQEGTLGNPGKREDIFRPLYVLPNLPPR
jgi:hypothetical protein